MIACMLITYLPHKINVSKPTVVCVTRHRSKKDMSTFQDLLFPPTEKIDDKEETVKWEDWNERFQNALNMPQRTLEERITRFDAMNTINEDFKCVRIFFYLRIHIHIFLFIKSKNYISNTHSKRFMCTLT